MAAPLSRRRGAPSSRRVGSGGGGRLLFLIAVAVPVLIITMLRTYQTGGNYGTYETISALELLPYRKSQDRAETAGNTASAAAAAVAPPENVWRQRPSQQVSDEANFREGGGKTAPLSRSMKVKNGEMGSKDGFLPLQKVPTGSRSDRRVKAHFCRSRVHGEIGMKILQSEFGFESIDAEKDEDWDLIYGGYPHCGRIRAGYDGNEQRWDWEMKYGLNHIMNERGWNNLKPHQVYHPCMGCANSYCNKRELCRILRDINPELCYVLPDDLERLRDAMDGSRIWVMKKDAFNVHIHTGRGVSYIKNPRELPPSDELSKGVYLVQPWNEPFLGEGMYRRKSELRIFVAVTSVYPLRAYAYKDMFVVIAGKEYTNATEAMSDRCMHDTHSNTKKCDRFVSPDLLKDLKKISPDGDRKVRFEDYVERAGMTKTQQEQLVGGALDMIYSVLKAGHPMLEDHHINKGIHSSGAMCFSHMRVDIGISTDARPFIFEFPELHGSFGKMDINAASNRDLFRMIGLDRAPVPQDERAAFEATNLGRWRPLPILN